MKSEYFFPFSLWSNHVVREKPILVPRSLPKLLQNKKNVDHPTDGTYQGQSNSIATTTHTKGNRGVTVRHQELYDGYGGGRMELVILDLKELRSQCHLPKSQTPLRKVMEERHCLQNSRPEGRTSTSFGSKSPQTSL